MSLFETLDVIFSLLRVVCPTEEEMTKIEKSIQMLEVQWNDLELTHTPKFHILVEHTVVQVRLFGGIADLAEDLGRLIYCPLSGKLAEPCTIEINLLRM